jgi:hypothetical protein
MTLKGKINFINPPNIKDEPVNAKFKQKSVKESGIEIKAGKPESME